MARGYIWLIGDPLKSGFLFWVLIEWSEFSNAIGKKAACRFLFTASCYVGFTSTGFLGVNMLCGMVLIELFLIGILFLTMDDIGGNTYGLLKACCHTGTAIGLGSLITSLIGRIFVLPSIGYGRSSSLGWLTS